MVREGATVPVAKEASATTYTAAFVVAEVEVVAHGVVGQVVDEAGRDVELRQAAGSDVPRDGRSVGIGSDLPEGVDDEQAVRSGIEVDAAGAAKQHGADERALQDAVRILAVRRHRRVVVSEQGVRERHVE